MNKKTLIASVLLCLCILIAFFIIKTSIQDNEIAIKEQRIVRESVGLTPTYNPSEIRELTAEVFEEKKESLDILKTSGQLSIPSINVNVNIYEGLNEEHILVGAGEQFPRSKVKNGNPGNYVLAGHRYKYTPNFLFSNLPQAKEGMMIYSADEYNIYEYEIVWAKPYHMTDISPLEDDLSGDSVITLYTCYGLESPSVERFVVRGKLVNTKPIKESPQELIDKFSYQDSSEESFVEKIYSTKN